VRSSPLDHLGSSELAVRLESVSDRLDATCRVGAPDLTVACLRVVTGGGKPLDRVITSTAGKGPSERSSLRRVDVPYKGCSTVRCQFIPGRNLGSTFGLARACRTLVVESHGLRASRSLHVVSAGLGSGDCLSGVRLHYRPAGCRITLRLDEGVYDRGELPEDP
jgi:hypothetical protein